MDGFFKRLGFLSPAFFIIEGDKAGLCSWDNDVEALTAINEGLVKGMNEAGRLYEEEEYFVPELLLCSDAGIILPSGKMIAKKEYQAVYPPVSRGRGC